MPEMPITTKEIPIANPNLFSLKWWVSTIIAVLVVNPFPEPITKSSIANYERRLRTIEKRLSYSLPTINPTDTQRSIADTANADKITPDTISIIPTAKVQRCDLMRHNGPTNKPKNKNYSILHN